MKSFWKRKRSRRVERKRNQSPTTWRELLHIGGNLVQIFGPRKNTLKSEFLNENLKFGWSNDLHATKEHWIVVKFISRAAAELAPVRPGPGPSLPNKIRTTHRVQAHNKMSQRLLLQDKPCVGLFGTRGESTWRQSFIDYFNAFGIYFYNPLVPSTQESEREENEHLLDDEIILFPVTRETYGTGPLTESAYQMIAAVKANTNRYIIIYIDPTVDSSLASDQVAYRDSVRARAAALSFLKKNPHSNVFVVSSLNQMQVVATRLYDLVLALKQLHSTYNLSHR